MNYMDRRTSKRIPLHPPMAAKLFSIDADQQETKVSILDVGLMGIKFRTEKDLDISTEVLLNFDVRGCPTNIVQGPVVYKKSLDDSFEYGIEFYLNDKEAEIWTDSLERIIHDCDPANRLYPYEICDKYV